MYTTQLDNGILNSYAKEPEMYYATYPSAFQQQRYALQGGLATLFVTALVLFSFGIH